MSDVHEGGCLCGNVRYRVTGRPVTALVCHCRFCQKTTGSSFYAQAMFTHDAVEFTGGELSRYDHRSEGSGKLVGVHFCPRCGSMLTLTLERWPHLRTISRGTFDDPDWFRADAHIWTELAQTGVVLPADMDCFDRMRIQLDGTPEQARRFESPHPLN
jgi:hypothetical protein